MSEPEDKSDEFVCPSCGHDVPTNISPLDDGYYRCKSCDIASKPYQW